MPIATPRMPLEGSPLDRNQLRKRVPGGPLYDFLDFQSVGKVHFFDDFLGDTINLDNYALANSGGTSAADFAVVAGSGGRIRGDTGTDDNGSLSLIGPLIWYGDNNAGLEMRVKTDIVTGFNLEVGFIDAVPAANAGGINDEDTPTFNAADCALFAIDTDETVVTAGFYTEGSTANQDVKRTTLAGVPGFTSGTLPVADVFYTVRVQLVGNSAYCWVNGKLVASHDDDAQGNLEGGVALAPWVYCRTRSTTAVFPFVDYIRVWQDR